MKPTHYRVTERKTFVEALGVIPMTPERSAHSPATMAVTYFIDNDGRTLAYVAHGLNESGNFMCEQHAIATDPVEIDGDRNTLWL